VSATPVAPLAGAVNVGAGGAAPCVVKDHATELLDPMLSLATTRQKYTVAAASVPGAKLVPAVVFSRGGEDEVPKYTS
jgi:hypothetical protein